MATGRLESGLIDGATATRVDAVGVENEDADPSSIPFFQSRDIASVDDIDQVAGQVATVFALLGARGSFGIKDTADRLLPDLLEPRPGTSAPDGPPAAPPPSSQRDSGAGAG